MHFVCESLSSTILDKKAPLLLLKELLHNITTCTTQHNNLHVLLSHIFLEAFYAVIILYAHPVPIIAYALICSEGALLIRVKEFSYNIIDESDP
jgi:hypothetical protein